jgi:hypothetical protein
LDRDPVAGRGGEVRRITVEVAVEPELLVVIGHGPTQLGHEQNGRDTGQDRHAKILIRGKRSDLLEAAKTRTSVQTLSTPRWERPIPVMSQKANLPRGRDCKARGLSETAQPPACN